MKHFLVELGFNCISISEDNPGISDKEVLDKANKENRVIITNDKDFGELIFNQKLLSFGVILLRIQDESVENKIRVLKIAIDKYRQMIGGNFTIITEKSIRIRKIKLK